MSWEVLFMVKKEIHTHNDAVSTDLVNHKIQQCNYYFETLHYEQNIINLTAEICKYQQQNSHVQVQVQLASS